MIIQNPFRHYSYYIVRIYLKDGTMFYNRGTARKQIDLPVKEEDLGVLVIEACDSGRKVCDSRMWDDGIWAPVDEAKLEELLAPPKPEPEDESKKDDEAIIGLTVGVDTGADVDATDEVEYEVKRVEDVDDYKDEDEDGRFGLGCT